MREGWRPNRWAKWRLGVGEYKVQGGSRGLQVSAEGLRMRERERWQDGMKPLVLRDSVM